MISSYIDNWTRHSEVEFSKGFNLRYSRGSFGSSPFNQREMSLSSVNPRTGYAYIFSAASGNAGSVMNSSVSETDYDG